MEFSRQEYWIKVPFPTIEDFSDPGIELMSLESPALAGGFFATVPPRKPLKFIIVVVLVTQCLTLCDSMDCSSPVSSVHGIFQARILEWVAFSFSRGSSQPRDGT